MSTSLKPMVCLVLALIFSGSGWASDEMNLYVPKSRAPMDVHKGGSGTTGSVSVSEISEFSGEFGGILYMGQRPYQYERWPGKDISDCRMVSNGEACGECELIMGHSNADYYFYRDSDRRCTLQLIDAHFQVSDPAILKPLRRTAAPLLGDSSRGSKTPSKEVGWEGTGPGWKWESDTDVAYLYMDTEQGSGNDDGVARFQWRRSPLLKTSSSR